MLDSKRRKIKKNDHVWPITEPGRVGVVVDYGFGCPIVQFDDNGERKEFHGNSLVVVRKIEGVFREDWEQFPDPGRRLRWEEVETYALQFWGFSQKTRLFYILRDFETQRWFLKSDLPGYRGKIWPADPNATNQIEDLKDKADRLLVIWGRRRFPELEFLGSKKNG